MPQSRSVNRILEFYSGRAPDHAGRFLKEIQQWPDQRLEAVHDFIQWLFPLLEPSPVNPFAPVLDPQTIAAFKAEADLRAHLLASFLRMLKFYGLELRAEPRLTVVRAANFRERAANWLSPGNHNHLRITRILKCLSLLGLHAEAQAFLECLAAIYAEQRGQARPGITSETFRFWQTAIAV